MEQSSLKTFSDENAVTVGFQSSEGFQVSGTVLRLTPRSVTFEICGPQVVLQLSEVLLSLDVRGANGSIYNGRATVSGLMNTGTATVYEAALGGVLLGAEFGQNGGATNPVPSAFNAFLKRWQTSCRIIPEYKLAVEELQSFLQEFRMWLDQVELGIDPLPSHDRGRIEEAVLKELPARRALSALFERFETAAASVPEELVPFHRTFCRRQLHPLLLCCPFMHRIYTKPLGYAGDYEMIDMIIRNELEGSSFFAKFLHSYILDQAPARSVRNRAACFTGRFVEETNRISHLGRTASIFSLGCGPAREVERFLTEHELSNRTQFRLLDFNAETLTHTSKSMERVRRERHRSTAIKLDKQSVQSLLKEAAKPLAGGPRYDLIYCSGLYDYLSDRVCKTLNTYLYDCLQPGGVLIITNFDPFNPIRNIMEHVFEWFLIHRNGRQMVALAPDQVEEQDCAIWAESAGCNVFLEVRKPGLKK